MSDRRIDHFFSGGGGQLQKCNFFYVDWSQPKRAEWRIERPRHVQWESDVVWKDMGRLITVCCTVKPLEVIDLDQDRPVETTPEVSPPPPLYQDKTLVSLLKSNLQKCVRRQHTKRALETARYLMELDPCLFVRRLSIIMLEDVVLHQSFCTLTWLTAALSRGFRLNDGMRQWLLGVVDYLCRHNMEHYWSLAIDNTMRDIGKETLRRLCADSVERSDRDIVHSLLFRYAYGGLPGDLSMLVSFTSHTAVTATDAIVPLSLDSVQLLALDRVEPCAADFHCMPRLCGLLARQFTRYSEQQIKQAVWHHSSKLNARVVSTGEQRDKENNVAACYSAIRRQLEVLQQQHITQCRNTVLYQTRSVTEKDG